VTGLNVHIPTLGTERLILRAPRLEDFEAYAATFASPRSGYTADEPSRRNAWYSFAADVASWITHGFGTWSVDLRGGGHVGTLGVNRFAHYPEPELGWMLHDGHEGRGYATEAGRAALAWARGRVGSLVSYVAPGNARSVALAERLGARLDAAAALPDGEDHAGTAVYRHWGPA
jgi:RimJ/RimL family protein N-acetyltransferase